MPRATVSENFKKSTIFIKQKMHSLTISKVRKNLLLAPTKTMKNAIFRQKKTRLLDWNCAHFFHVLAHSASASAGLLQNQPAPTSIVVIPSVSRNVVPGDPRNGGHQRHWWSVLTSTFGFGFIPFSFSIDWKKNKVGFAAMTLLFFWEIKKSSTVLFFMWDLFRCSR